MLPARKIAVALVIALATGSIVRAQAPSVPPLRPTLGEGREIWMHPFSVDSIWNTPLGKGAKYQSPDGVETAMWRNRDAGGPNGAYRSIGFPEFAIQKARPTDPIMKWTYEHRAGTLPWPFTGRDKEFLMRTPTNTAIDPGSDGHLIIISEDGAFAYEFWQARFDPTKMEYRATYVVRTPLYGPGMAQRDGISEGIRAAGVSMLGGIVRCYELEERNIPHALSMMASPKQLKKAPTMAEQKVWPATHTDGSGTNNYSGVIPMGALFAIPQSVDLNSLGLKTPEGKALARAFQQFGGYVVDAATNTSKLAMVEGGCDKKLVDNLFVDMEVLFASLAMVTNNTPETPGGPGERIAPRPPAPRPRS